jgi:hypothetical protein
MKNETKDTAAIQIAIPLFEGEDSLDLSIGRFSAVIAAMQNMKVVAGLSVLHAQGALEAATDLLTILAQARRKTGELHRRLDLAQRDIGLTPIAFGPVGKPDVDLMPALSELPAAAV